MTAVLTNLAQLDFRTDNLSLKLTQQNQSWPMNKNLTFSKKHSCINKFGLFKFSEMAKNFKVDKCTKSWNFNDITAVSTNWAQIGLRTDGIDMYGYTGVK